MTVRAPHDPARPLDTPKARRALLDALPLYGRGCDFCDVRLERSHKTKIVARAGELVTVASIPALGAFVRVLHGGRWHYAATTDLASLDAILTDLVAKARDWTDAAGPVRGGRAWWQDLGPRDGAWPLMDVEPADATPLAAKRALVEQLMEVLADVPSIARSEVIYGDTFVEKHYASSTGARLRADVQHVGARAVYALRDGDARFDDYSRGYAPDFPHLAAAYPAKLAADVAASVPFLHAPLIAAGHYRMVLDGSVVGVFAHEAFGHKSEADFLLGDERALAEWPIGKEVASEALTIVDDGAMAGTSGWCPFDDEGEPAAATPLIERGRLAGRLHARGTAAALGEGATGNGRAMSFEFEPIPRMTCTYVARGEEPFDALIARVDDGLYVKSVAGGTGLSTFTMAGRKAYRIRDGKLAEPVRVGMIAGTVGETLAAVEACGDDFVIESNAVGGCGKFEQVPLPVAYGGPSVLIARMYAS